MIRHVLHHEVFRFIAPVMSWSTLKGARLLCLRPHAILRSLQVQAESAGEKKLAEILKQSFSASQIAVKDISGGCGAMYEIFVESEDFRGKRQVQQHRLVNKALGDEVKSMHGLRIFTAVPGEK